VHGLELGITELCGARLRLLHRLLRFDRKFIPTDCHVSAPTFHSLDFSLWLLACSHERPESRPGLKISVQIFLQKCREGGCNLPPGPYFFSARLQPAKCRKLAAEYGSYAASGLSALTLICFGWASGFFFSSSFSTPALYLASTFSDHGAGVRFPATQKI
jgi:hypothetical protein